jgi:phospholipase C
MPNDPIERVIVLMMENRSFDHMLGCMKQVYPTLEGIDTKNPLTNPESDPKLPAIAQQARPRDITNPDPKHETPNVLFQLDSPAPGKCQGFVQDYVNFYAGAGKPPFDHSETMCYFPLGSLGALHALAQSFTICDHWFSSLPGPTWPNRFFVTTGTSLGHVDMPQGIFHPAIHNYNQDTIFNQLGNVGKGLQRHPRQRGSLEPNSVRPALRRARRLRRPRLDQAGGRRAARRQHFVIFLRSLRLAGSRPPDFTVDRQGCRCNGL